MTVLKATPALVKKKPSFNLGWPHALEAESYKNTTTQILFRSKAIRHCRHGISVLRREAVEVFLSLNFGS